MASQKLIFEKKESIALIKIVNPIKTILDVAQLSYDFRKFFEEISFNEEIMAILISLIGGEIFYKETFSNRNYSIFNHRIETEFHSFFRSINEINKPVVVAIEGDAIGLGLELVLACDLRIASLGSHFSFPQIKQGFIPCVGGTQRLVRLVGRSKALEMILTGEVIDAQEALRIGLVNRVVPEREVMEVSMRMAQEMASKAPIALRYAKEAVNKGMEMTLEQGLRLEADLYLLLHTTRDRTEGIQAFREKRVPKFEGR